MLSEIAILTLLTVILVLAFSINRVTADITPLKSRRRVRKTLTINFIVNIILYAAIVFLFLKMYGMITDDRAYFGGIAPYGGKYIWEARNGTEFMQLFSGVIRRATGLDLPGFHILFASMGFIGSLLYFRTLLMHNGLKNVKINKELTYAILALLCFPNIIAWGRFFGKDSLSFFLAAIWILNTYVVLFKKHSKWNYTGIILSGFFLFIVRGHIAVSLIIAFIVALIVKIGRTHSRKNRSLVALIKIYGPVMLVIVGGISVYILMTRMTETKDSSFSDVQQTIEQANRMGAYGGSARTQSDEFKTMEIFSPVKMGVNILYLYFAPFPWEMRGAIDMIALVSNLLLLYLVVKYYRNINLKSIWGIYLIVIIVLFTILLSFITGNIGLILRQKTILIPFIFLLLFSKSPKNETTGITTGNNLPERRNNTEQ